MPETRTPYTTRTLWDTLQHRLVTAAQSVGGICTISISIVAYNGEVLSWSRPDVTPYEPRRDAEKLARLLTFGSSGIIELDDDGKPVQ